MLLPSFDTMPVGNRMKVLTPTSSFERLSPSAYWNPPMFGLGTTELLIFLVVATLLFGSARIPSLMRNLGRSATEFKKGMRDENDDPKDELDNKN